MSETITGRKVKAPRDAEAGVSVEGLGEEAQRGLVRYSMTVGKVQIQPTHTTIVPVGNGRFGEVTEKGFWLVREANGKAPFSRAYDPANPEDAAKIAAIDEWCRKYSETAKKIRLEVVKGPKLAPPVDEWDTLKAEACVNILDVLGRDPEKALAYERQKDEPREDVIAAIEVFAADKAAKAKAEGEKQAKAKKQAGAGKVDAVAI